jgi:beta-phosphoglucomutase
MSKTKLNAVIFDLDGVICSTDEYHYLAWKALADSEGIPFDREINNQLRGISRMASLEIILRKANRSYSLEEKERLCEEKNLTYRHLLER